MQRLFALLGLAAEWAHRAPCQCLSSLSAHLLVPCRSPPPRYCYDRGYLQCLWECGGTLAAPAIAGGAIHKTIAFVAPKLVSF